MAKSDDRSAATRKAVADTAAVAEAREAVASVGRRQGQQRGPADPFTGNMRRAVLPLLVLHLIRDEESYGNQMMEWISEATAGVLSVNPNTMYPLLRQLESEGFIEGRWEHPERRSRRYYSLTKEGQAEYERIRGEVRPLLETIAQSLTNIVEQVYG
ncbi:MAG: PadR family transcriptional regulator, regulatory protein PadR [Thermoleophilaceae bacterium]|nr:PadR family transcriptional regulator, regulatory protein PadR [Thermoleophilaceae bacterium]